jgi:hypothetical protein
MKSNESIANKHNRISRGKTAIRAGALSVGLLLSAAPIANASEAHNTEPAAAASARPETLSQVITAQEKRISDDIGKGVPITFRAGMAYYHGGNVKPFDIINPLWFTAEVGSGRDRKPVKFVGYIEQKGGPTGPDVVVLEYNKKTIDIEQYYDNPALPIENRVIFPPSYPVEASFDTGNPVNPLTGDKYIYPQNGQPLLVGCEVLAKS